MNLFSEDAEVVLKEIFSKGINDILYRAPERVIKNREGNKLPDILTELEKNGFLTLVPKGRRSYYTVNHNAVEEAVYEMNK